jgi:hypothetical protein
MKLDAHTAGAVVDHLGHFSLALPKLFDYYAEEAFGTVHDQKFERLLKPGDERTLEVQYELALSVGDVAAVTMTVNGVAARPLGKSGQVVTVRLNPTNINTYLPPR